MNEETFHNGKLQIPHARSGADDLNVVQYFLVDVIAFIVALLLLIGITLFYVVRFTCRLCCGSCIGDKKKQQATANVDATKKTN